MQVFDGSRIYTAEVGGRPLSIETGVLAIQAGGNRTLWRYGGAGYGHDEQGCTAWHQLLPADGGF